MYLIEYTAYIITWILQGCILWLINSPKFYLTHFSGLTHLVRDLPTNLLPTISKTPEGYYPLPSPPP